MVAAQPLCNRETKDYISMEKVTFRRREVEPFFYFSQDSLVRFTRELFSSKCRSHFPTLGGNAGLADELPDL